MNVPRNSSPVRCITHVIATSAPESYPAQPASGSCARLNGSTAIHRHHNTAIITLTTPLIATLAALLFPVLALPNDGIAGVSADVIVFRKTDAIAMKKEMLNVSPSLIRVDYEFLNKSPNDVKETIVFLLPAYPAMTQGSDTY
ncbi:DUF4424 family protein [Massilia atriviolacea]|uniref:DUF4424 domain-containing protein n=1 Tax=Massilia atriviolacea TaxID=2495579 RepID=A0A430HH48_9BURK|nr:DUF4424 family protein [Massilia atriviolacea]RSZ56864.1 DUF4424 domain-containing protein [Massilia atriviolacea]